MAGMLRKAGLYLGLVDDEEYGDYDDRYEDGYDERDDRRRPARDAGREGYRDAPRAPERPAVRAVERPARPAARPEPRRYDERPPAVEDYEDTDVRRVGGSVDSYRITTLQPTTYNEARTIGEHFREGVPVIINLTEMDDADAKRLVDFCAGLIFGLHGSIERVTNKVFLLSPSNVQVSEADKARIAEGGFFNQS